MKIKKLILIALLPILTLFGCNSTDTLDPSPREITGVFKYTGATYSPIHFNARYRYAINDLDGKFIAYVDTTRIVLSSTNALIDNVVDIRGSLVKENGDNVFRAESIKLKK
ncbi:MAG: hypothetical protein E7036_07545 [Opitutales bacterium]|nr:hypothetical protein [Opitutales bacterium]MBP3357958.1 hypothetical protein [Opitutales bacterium]MBQ2722354.1 hypothetical protein [Opitutales bacterium]